MQKIVQIVRKFINVPFAKKIFQSFITDNLKFSNFLNSHRKVAKSWPSDPPPPLKNPLSWEKCLDLRMEVTTCR